VIVGVILVELDSVKVSGNVSEVESVKLSDGVRVGVGGGVVVLLRLSEMDPLKLSDLDK
jgi:hypothetical protein